LAYNYCIVNHLHALPAFFLEKSIDPDILIPTINSLLHQ